MHVKFSTYKHITSKSLSLTHTKRIRLCNYLKNGIQIKINSMKVNKWQSVTDLGVLTVSIALLIVK